MKLVPDYYGVASNQIGPFSMTTASMIWLDLVVSIATSILAMVLQ